MCLPRWNYFLSKGSLREISFICNREETSPGENAKCRPREWIWRHTADLTKQRPYFQWFYFFLLTSQRQKKKKKKACSPLLNTFFNLNDKYFLHLPRLLHICKRLTVTNWFLWAFQASLPEGDLTSLWPLQHSLQQLSSFTVTLGSALALSLGLVLFVNSAASVSYPRISHLGSFTGLNEDSQRASIIWVGLLASSCFFKLVSKKLTPLFQCVDSSLSR